MSSREGRGDRHPWDQGKVQSKSALEKDSEAHSVAVVIPVWRSPLSEDELLSVRSWWAHLSSYPTVLLAPQGFDPQTLAASETPDEPSRNALEALIRQPVESFEPSWFESRQSYNHLLMTEGFYRRFEKAGHLLIFQLDCLAFSGDLGPFLDAETDYVGAPWFLDPQRAEAGLSRIGNGGLSLRRVDAALAVLTSQRYRQQPVPWLGTRPGQLFGPISDRPSWRRRARILREIRRGVPWYCRHYGQNEDHFWSDRAPLFDPDFRPAPLPIGLAFAFERFPRYCWHRNGSQLPFGCHAWTKFDRDFWTPWLPRALGERTP
ncbi:MAG: DUF5672 family protein [Acidobacteriota bacterium]